MKINVKIDDIPFGTSIQDLKVPDVLKKRIPTGLEYFDAVIGGEGFTPSMVTLFTGTPGSGKTTMMLSLANSLQGHGAQVVFNTAEESLFQVKMTTERLRLRNSFMVGGLDNVEELLKGCDKVRADHSDRPFFLIVDSLQCMNDGYFKSGRITAATSERSLQMITNYAKEHACNILVIGQVTKDGKMAGSNKLKHMVDSHIHLSVEDKDEDLRGCRVLETQKNRFGGCGHIIFLNLRKAGFEEVARISAAGI
jgi:DNA repair protein RadA/Sms|tara:strand:+ start:1641 stop:2396 length:756 start_codon:yes stop_codon:yes gene_type:complete